ncbi:blood vessel epicardial substance [Plakobranchus ocellatus]|uniref:Blood vessel epicardial substance n=1 Tax=Plakobranchus ocellatus TaxID=259542 RepID=A0AAV3ZRH0_9GAST|nr:blood vessel epicardial substance [Plakobranchus ocellatus]
METLSGCTSWQPTNHVLYHLANVMLCIGLMVPDSNYGALLLHGFMFLGYLLMSVWSWVILCAPDFFSWNFAFLLLNAVQTFSLMYSVRPVKFCDELEAVYVSLFLPLRVSRQLYKRLVCPEFCTLMTLHEGETYATQSVTRTDKLGLLISGTYPEKTDHSSFHWEIFTGLSFYNKIKMNALNLIPSSSSPLSPPLSLAPHWHGPACSMHAYSNRSLLHVINEKQFIDSPEFESTTTGDAKFQVSIVAASMCRYLFWPRQHLEYLLIKEPHLACVMKTIIGRDVTNKLYALNEKVSPPDGRRLDIRLPGIPGSLRDRKSVTMASPEVKINTINASDDNDLDKTSDAGEVHNTMISDFQAFHQARARACDRRKREREDCVNLCLIHSYGDHRLLVNARPDTGGSLKPSIEVFCTLKGSRVVS